MGPDRLAALLDRFRIETSLFHTGPMCGVTTFEPRPGRGFLHVLRRGEMEVTHPDDGGGLTKVTLRRPTLLFYPRPLRHAFHNPPVEGSDLTCAALDFAGGGTHPLLGALPAAMTIPLADVPSLAPVLDVLFAETDSVRCGHRLIADRLFEVVLIQLLRWVLAHAAELGLPPGLLAGLSDPDLTPALVAVHEAPGAQWSLTGMAQAARMSRSAFAARFKTVVGMAPGEYLTQWRLTIAQSRLRDGEPVGVVARDLGYVNASSFSRVFTRHLGASPRHWLADSPLP